jgi:hypothetical protein
MALLNSLANGFLEVAGDRDPELSVPGSGDSPEPNREAYGDSAIALIDSLAEHLLSPQVRTVGGLAAKAPAVPTGANTTGHLEEATTPERSPFAPLDSGRGEPIGRLTTGPKPSDTNEEVPGVAFDRYVDAETFASLVNDVLVEQARRHGVDLS